MRQHTLLFKQLEFAEAMRTYIAQHIDDSEDLHFKLKLVESELTAARKAVGEGVKSLRMAEWEGETTNAEARRLREKGEVAETKCKKIEQENERLRKEMEQLRAGFVAQKKKLKDEYQKQVDEMFFFGYQCCMKKHDIAHDIPPYFSDDEDIAAGGPVQGDGDTAAVGPSGGQS